MIESLARLVFYIVPVACRLCPAWRPQSKGLISHNASLLFHQEFEPLWTWTIRVMRREECRQVLCGEASPVDRGCFGPSPIIFDAAMKSKEHRHDSQRHSFVGR